MWPWLVVVAVVAFVFTRNSGGRVVTWPIRPKRIDKQGHWSMSTFGASRDGGTRLHAGNDILAYPGDEIVAMADGVVLHNVSGFGIFGSNPPAGYVPLQAVAIDHGSVQMLYAEIRVEVKPGQRVTAGQRIGRADRNGDGNTMLHLEAWEKAPKGFTPWVTGQRPAGLLNVNDFLAGL
jgi:murein DD-endopeptidase MepM/ murein hydrolase activator NlpD